MLECAAAKQGMLKLRIGDSSAKFQHSFVGVLLVVAVLCSLRSGNVAHLHLLAADNLRPTASGAAGNSAFCLSIVQAQ